MVKTKIVSSLEKALLEEDIDSFKALEKISALKGERLSLQLLHTNVYDGEGEYSVRTEITAAGLPSGCITLRDLCNVPVERPTLERANDEDYISKRPGLYPDLLRPLHYKNAVFCSPNLLRSVWIEINIPKELEAGEYTLTLKLSANGETVAENSVKIEVVEARLPDDDIYLTQWFHCDCLATYYDVPVWSEKHWRIIENFAKVAVKNGINMLLTPVFTPPLDTAVGGERLTVQLVGVTVTDGEYTFDFSLLDRWVAMCDRIGIKYLEISHLFTQWGAKHAPKVMATVGGEYKKIFGWETDATGAEYTQFIRAFLKEFLAHMKLSNNDKRCFFHISDEPTKPQLESYRAAKSTVADILRGYTVMDALSDYDFWKLGIVETPIPVNDRIAPFIENGVPNLWTYYCCCETDKVSNRFIQMTSWRNRSIGYQMYKFGIVGFLHWGYNFYSNRWSGDPINPFIQQDGDDFVTPGDAYSVYPAQNGKAYESIRIIVFHEALQDIKAMKLCAKYVGKEAVVKLIDEAIGTDVTFDTCAKSAEQILSLRERINMLIKEHTAKK